MVCNWRCSKRVGRAVSVLTASLRCCWSVHTNRWQYRLRARLHLISSTRGRCPVLVVMGHPLKPRLTHGSRNFENWGLPTAFASGSDLRCLPLHRAGAGKSRITSPLALVVLSPLPCLSFHPCVLSFAFSRFYFLFCFRFYFYFFRFYFGFILFFSLSFHFAFPVVGVGCSLVVLTRSV